MNLKTFFDKGMTYDNYVSELGEHEALHQLHYKKARITDEVETHLRSIKPVNILVLTEPWCGDSLAIFPVVRKMAEVHGSWNIRVLLRDQNLDLMDQFLTRGGRAVPLFFFLSEDYSLIFKWGPRPTASQQIFEDHRKLIQEGKIEKIEVIKKIRSFYAKDRGQAIINELLSVCKEHHCK